MGALKFNLDGESIYKQATLEERQYILRVAGVDMDLASLKAGELFDKIGSAKWQRVLREAAQWYYDAEDDQRMKATTPLRPAPKFAGGMSPVGGIGKGPVEIKPEYVVRWVNAQGEPRSQFVSGEYEAEQLAAKIEQRGPEVGGPMRNITVTRRTGGGGGGHVPESIGR